ncbi:Sec-independent protein translocase subunit TatA [Brevibacterium marinum]|uniref:Sec-independent protein translocase protein TatA n=1 Tax=Brevibacterium marinum TaxID=418643 RepID=A0A846S355_9MICO|nr:Sec-independent protein translocase subunit TatA [Brevibacterium marinum]NJC57433.1 sec-independent protein translocase protein TatA [Brevibacterium marinum]
MKPSFVQIAIVILIIVIIFGAPKLPGLARSLGQSMKIFKSEVKDLRKDDDEEPKTTEPGELNREATENDTSSTASNGSRAEAVRDSEQPAKDKQDPQSHEK